MSAPPLLVTAADGARASIYSLGAQVASWVPAGDSEQFFTATHAPVGEKAFKGGVPVCFPQFAGGPLPQHGFARDTEWTPAGQGEGWAAMRLTEAGPMSGRWPHPFVLELRVEVGGPRIEISLSVENPGARAWYFTGALHTYLQVDDIARVSVDGLGGRSYLDKTRGGREMVQRDAALRLTEETDRVYLGAPSPVTLRDGSRAVEITATGFPDVVTWNPWSGAEARWPQFGADDYRRMICVEAAVVGTPVSLERGQRWSGSQALRVLP